MSQLRKVAYQKAYYATHKEEIAARKRVHYHREEQRAHRERRHAILDRHKHMVGCSVCRTLGQETTTRLLYHHPDESNKVADVGQLVSTGKWSSVKAEVKKCIVMCSHHHSMLPHLRSPKSYDVTLRFMVPMWLHSAVKSEAIASGRTMSDIVREVLCVRFPRPEKNNPKPVR